MNKCFFQGRLTTDPEKRALASGGTVTKFSLAVRRPTKNGEKEVDFVNCTIWIESLQEFADKWLHKGDGVVVVASYSPRKLQDGRVVGNFNVVELEFPIQRPKDHIGNTQDDCPFN